MRKVFLEELPHKGNNIDWKYSIKYFVHFIYDNIEGDIEIINYEPKNQLLYIKYLEQDIFKINTNSFHKVKLGNMLGIITSEFKIKIGQTFKDNKRDLIITNSEYRKIPKQNNRIQNQKWYKYTCNKCGWTEGWIVESDLTKGNGCACCCLAPRVIVEGINDIPTTAPWMVKYFQGGYKEAKLYTKSSGQKIIPICPDCGRIKDKPICIDAIYKYKTIFCSCSDKISYSEKFMFNILEQLKLNFQTQLNKTTFEWCNNYRYDFYFKLNKKEYISEVNGLQHYEDSNGSWKIKLEKQQENDKTKKQLALNNGIKEENYIVIDCRRSELAFIKQNILNSRLNELFDLSKINWNIAEEFALSNLVKIACDYKRNNPELTSIEIGKLMKLSQCTIIKYLKQGSKLDWCEYIPKEEIIKASIKVGKLNRKPVICINTKQVFESATDCAKQSLNVFGVKLNFGEISAVCRGKRKFYKGRIFKYVQDLTEEEYIKYNVLNNKKHDDEADRVLDKVLKYKGEN